MVIAISSFSKDRVCKKPDFAYVVSHIHFCYSKLEWYKSKSWVHTSTTPFPLSHHYTLGKGRGISQDWRRTSSQSSWRCLPVLSIGGPVAAAVSLTIIWQCKYFLQCNGIGLKSFSLIHIDVCKLYFVFVCMRLSALCDLSFFFVWGGMSEVFSSLAHFT